MSNLYQIHEEDLADLEKLLPQMAQELEGRLNNRMRIKLRRCQQIMSKIRWNYGPPSEMTVIPADEGDADQAS